MCRAGWFRFDCTESEDRAAALNCGRGDCEATRCGSRLNSVVAVLGRAAGWVCE